MSWKDVGLASDLAMRELPESALPQTPAGRVEFVAMLLRGPPIVGDDGEPTGEYAGPLIDEETARRLLEGLE